MNPSLLLPYHLLGVPLSDSYPKIEFGFYVSRTLAGYLLEYLPDVKDAPIRKEARRDISIVFISRPVEVSTEPFQNGFEVRGDGLYGVEVTQLSALLCTHTSPPL